MSNIGEYVTGTSSSGEGHPKRNVDTPEKTGGHSPDQERKKQKVQHVIEEELRESSRSSLSADDPEHGRNDGHTSARQNCELDFEGHSGEAQAARLQPELKKNWNSTRIDNFNAMNLRDELLRGIYSYGFENPSKVQQRAIMPCIAGHDVLVQAAAGSGKTVLALVAILQQLDVSLKQCQALLLVPRREVGIWTLPALTALGNYMDVQCHACVGGTKVREDIQRVSSGVHVLVGTPGRVDNMIQRNVLDTGNIKIFILDEAADLFSNGFAEQVDQVFNRLNANTQVMILTSTLPEDLRQASVKLMRDPVHIRVNSWDGDV